MSRIATFHTHFGAMSFHKKLQKDGVPACMMPTPRALGASCGVCVRFEGAFDESAMPNSDMEAVYEETSGGYRLVYAQQEE